MSSQVHAPGPALPSCPPSAPSLLLPAFPGAALFVTSADAPGSKLIIKLKREGPIVGGTEEMPRTQTFFLTGMPLGWTTQRREGPPGPGVHTVLLTKAGEEPGSRKPRMPETVPPARAPPPSDNSFACTSKGVYENYRRWQRYKALARRHFPATPDAEALACFFIPVLRSLARLRPDMTLEDGVPRAVQEWEHSSNFERMIFYEMAEKFMEFEAEEEQQIQKMKLLVNCPPFQAPAPKPTKPPVPLPPEAGQQQVYIPKKSASKSRQPRRRQRRPPSTSAVGAPREIPAEAVHQYAEIMEGLDTSWEEEEDEKKDEESSRDPQGQEDGVFPDPMLAQYIDQLCEDEEFVCKVEAVIHPQFMSRLLSPEKSHDPLDLVEDLEEELNLTPNQVTVKRLQALTEEEREPSVYPASHSDSTPSQSEEEDEIPSNGKGGDVACRAMKRPSGSKGIRTSQTELSASRVISPPSPHSHQQLGSRNSLPKGVRATARPSLPKYAHQEPQEGNPLPSLKVTNDPSLGKDQISHHSIRISPHVQRVISQAPPNITGINNFSVGKGHNKTEEGNPKACTTQNSKQDGSQEGRVRGQREVPKVVEQSNQVVTVQLHSGSQLMWNNVESTNHKYAKQYVSPQGEVRCLKKANPKLGQSQVQKTGYENTSIKKEVEFKNREMKPHWNANMNLSSQENIYHTYEKQEGCEGGVVKKQCHFQVIWKRPKSTPTVAATHSGTVDSCCQNLTKQGNPTSVSPGPEIELESPKANIQSQKKPEVNWKQINSTNLKDNSTAKNSKLSTEQLLLQNQSVLIKQEDQQSDDPPMPETDQEVDLRSQVEITKGNGQVLTSADSGGIGTFENQVPSTNSEHLPIFTCSVQKSPPLRTQKAPKKGQKSQQPLSDQYKFTPFGENCSEEKPVLKPTLNPSNPDPLGFVASAKVKGDSCGTDEDHTRVSTSPGKAVLEFPPQLILQGGSSGGRQNNGEPTQKCRSNVTLSSKFTNLESDTKNLNKAEDGGLLERATLANISLPELPGERTETVLKCSRKGEEEEEDEELSSFSCLLASKLSLSTPCGCAPPPGLQGDTFPSSPRDFGKQGAKTRHSSRGQMSHNASTLASKKMEASPAVHRSHKRKSGSSGTRRSKRLRNQ